MKRALRCVTAGLGLALLLATAAAQSALRASTIEPRAFGYQAGDVVTRVVEVEMPAGRTLIEETLPLPGRLGPALELRRIERSSSRGPDGGTRLRLTLEFQIFAAPIAPRIVDLPTLQLGFTGGPRAEELRVEPWPLAVAPLGPEDASPRHGLGELRPDLAPPPSDVGVLRALLVAGLALAALAGAALALLQFGLPWLGRRRPFGLAWRELHVQRRRGVLADDAAGCRAATQRLHAALNEAAGRAVFAETVDAFVARAPRYAPLRDDLLGFFEDSQRAFFAGASGSAQAELRRLLDLARALRDAERGVA